MHADATDDPVETEIAGLRARVAELETELRALSVQTAATVAEAQEKLYWLERWHIDLDKLMAKPGAIPALDALKQVRGIARSVKKFRRRLLGS